MSEMYFPHQLKLNTNSMTYGTYMEQYLAGLCDIGARDRI